MAIQAVRGMKDLLPPEAPKWRFIEATAREAFAAFGFSEIRVPILERTELFARSIGEETDIVSKEMYTFEDRSGDSLTMRPEATAGVARAFLEHKLHATPGPHKLFTIGPMFRHERPQKGRLRQFHQLDCEVLDDAGPQSDAELLVLADHLLKVLGVAKVQIVLNSLGCPECRPSFKQALLSYFQDKQGRLCDDCNKRLANNPLRVLDCKQEDCKEIAAGAPLISASWCPDCSEHFDQVKRLLGLAGVSYALDPKLVRGLDYYTRTAFELKTGELGAQDAVGGGGRYDGLIQALGGPATPAIGFALGIERLALLIEDRPEWQSGPALFIAALGEEPRAWAFGAACALRKKGLWVEMSASDVSLKAQMRRANKMNAAQVLIVGGEELKAGAAPLKDMASGDQTDLPLDEIVTRLAAAGA
ncbi:MAG: histidine--tRNA ligase [Desulfarculaceae bacterium]|nr:histidine--tRNA ligase [Desulfarculaceae bacterium]MCF8071032.1 histidine--tRNA ligase [Desulfarculaceae bacterium]MCF8100620.1 histidine--tRNA ligase [Desulfarculaceae bacterium]MCF8116946.1 histidine--tRNA ligase [Desulfarculaceae bacterium]